MISFYNFQIFSLVIVLFLLLSTFYHCLEYYSNKEINNFKPFLYFLRVVAIFIIIFFYFHPIFTEENHKLNNSEFNIYIDASKSMQNNISFEKMNILFSDLENWFVKNNIKSNFFKVGKEIKQVEKINDLVFSENMTNMDNFRKHVINASGKNFLLITDGLRPFGQEQRYNFNKKINIIGVGSNNQSFSKFIDANLYKKEMQTFISFNLSETQPKIQRIELYNKDSKICSISDLMDTEFSNFNKVNISRLNLESFEGLRLIIKDDKNNFVDEINIRYNSFKREDSSVFFFSGGLSYNTKYFLELLNKLSFDSINFNYNINNFDKNNFKSQLTSRDMIFFDNFFQQKNDIKFFQSIIEEADKKSIPMFISFGKSHNYDSLKEISSLLLFNLRNEQTERRIEQKILSERYNILNGYYFDDIADYKIDCNENDSNIKFVDGSFFLCRNENIFLMFFPEIAKFSYKSIEFGNKNNFDDMIMDIISNAYYDNSRVYIYTRKNNYKNNEPIEVEFSSNSSDDYDDTELHIINKEKKFRIPIDKKFTIPYVGEHKIKLLDNYGNVLSNTLELTVEDFNSEGSLIGQDHTLLLNISKSSRGIYADISQLDTENFLSNINSNQNNLMLSLSGPEINFRNYLYYLILGAILLVIEWFLRKRLGLM